MFVDAPTAIAMPVAPPPEGSQLRRFLAERGVIVMRENRHIASVITTFGSPLEISGQVLVMVRGPSREVSLGVKFEQAESQSILGSAAFVDLDEIDELQNAVGFIRTAAEQMASERRDDTEVTYSTRDHVTVGFFQDGKKQQAFVRLGAASRHMFFAVQALAELSVALTDAKEYVNMRRSAWERR